MENDQRRPQAQVGGEQQVVITRPGRRPFAFTVIEAEHAGGVANVIDDIFGELDARANRAEANVRIWRERTRNPADEEAMRIVHEAAGLMRVAHDPEAAAALARLCEYLKQAWTTEAPDTTSMAFPMGDARALARAFSGETLLDPAPRPDRPRPGT